VTKDYEEVVPRADELFPLLHVGVVSPFVGSLRLVEKRMVVEIEFHGFSEDLTVLRSKPQTEEVISLTLTPLKTIMSPENQWLEDVFPT